MRHEMKQEVRPMPRAKFKRLSTANLARCFVAILAMDPDDQEMIAEALAADEQATASIRAHFAENRAQFGVPNTNNCAKLFDAILSTPKEVRESFVKEFDRVLSILDDHGNFGTKGERDPRGSHQAHRD